MHTPSLHLHPFAPNPGSSLELRCGVENRGDLLEFEFLLSGSRTDLDRVVWPIAKDPSRRERRDELWKSTCLELFLASANSTSYLEMNVAPSGDWNLYAFDDYRAGMRPAEGEVAIRVSPASAEPYLRLVGAVRAAALPPDLVFGATAVMEYRSGEREYWALTHAGEKPDFHLRASFTARLTQAGTTT